MSTEPTWRAYLTEWLIVWTSDASGPEGADECWDYFERKYKGRVREDDRRVVPAIAGVAPGGHPYCVQLRLPGLRGEYKDYSDAVALASELLDGHEGALCVVVQRGSSEEKALLEYGKKMLPGA
jgi:hypothetical protein